MMEGGLAWEVKTLESVSNCTWSYFTSLSAAPGVHFSKRGKQFRPHPLQ